jgi:hypothetical protein
MQTTPSANDAWTRVAICAPPHVTRTQVKLLREASNRAPAPHQKFAVDADSQYEGPRLFREADVRPLCPQRVTGDESSNFAISRSASRKGES